MRGIYKIVVACGNSPGKNVVKTSYVFTNDSRRARAKDVPEPRLSLFKQKKQKERRRTRFIAQQDPLFQTVEPNMGCTACNVSLLLSCVVYSIIETPPTHTHPNSFLYCVISPAPLFNSPSNNCLPQKQS